MKNRLATFDVDAQRGFTPLCPDELPVPGGDEIAGALNEMAALGSLRVGSKDAHPANPVWLSTSGQPMLTQLNYPNADLAWPRHCVVGTEGYELLEGLPRPEAYNFFVWKGIERDLHPYGACYHLLDDSMSTGVIEFLKAEGVTHVMVGGLAYEHCVATTARQLRKAGFEVALYEVAVRGIDTDMIQDARREMQAMGIVMLTTQAEMITYAGQVKGGA